MILLSFGHGYSAQALERLLLPKGWEIIGTTRSSEKAKSMQSRGVTARLFPSDDLSADLERATHILISAGPNEAGDPVLLEAREAIAQGRYCCALRRVWRGKAGFFQVDEGGEIGLLVRLGFSGGTLPLILYYVT